MERRSRMDKTIQNSLCRGLRASGIPKNVAIQVLNEIIQWYDCSGEQWTVDRIKAIRQWYETCLAGDPKPPKWVKRSKEGYPLGIWKRVFELPVGKALAVLSCGTVFYNTELTKPSKKKFLKGIHGNDTKEIGYGTFCQKLGVRWHSHLPTVSFPGYKLPKRLAPVWPTIFDMNGSIPIQDGNSTMHPDGNISEALLALSESWKSCPQVTLDFISDVLERPDVIPINVLGNQEYVWDSHKTHTDIVGRVSRIPEPELKDRWVANTNRIVQVTLDPMKDLIMSLVKSDPSNGIYDQPAGVAWAQTKLRQGRTLAGYDLTSASDLLNVTSCLNILENMFSLHKVEGWSDYRTYYEKICKSNWVCKSLGETVRWDQGSPMGTGPSIGILGLANDACGYLAWLKAVQQGVIDPTEVKASDCFRTIGDDFICIQEIGSYYEEAMSLLGGEINHTKTLTSDKVAEFAGRVILPNATFLKKIAYREPSDNSFMEYLSTLGDQAKYYLKPKQRKVANLFREVPGVVVSGPWNHDSFGLQLSERYQWYLEEVEPVLKRERPDVQMECYGMTLLRASYALSDPSTLENAHSREAASHLNLELDVPYPVLEDYQSSELSTVFRRGGDPRLLDEKTLLDALYQHVEAKDIKPFEEWKLEKTPGLSDSQSSAVLAEFDELVESTKQEHNSRVSSLSERLRVDHRMHSSYKDVDFDLEL
jgi:hypothetical protein